MFAALAAALDTAAAGASLATATTAAPQSTLDLKGGTAPRAEDRLPETPALPGRGKVRPVAAAPVRGLASRLIGLPQMPMVQDGAVSAGKDDSKTVPVPVFAPPPLPAPPLLSIRRDEPAAAPVKAVETPPPVERVRVDAPAIEIHIKEPAPPAPVPAPAAEKAAVPVLTPTASLPVPAAAPVVSTPVAAARHETARHEEVEHVAHVAPEPPAAPPAAPLRSFALEFTPDGAHDVKVRLSERGGEVHVSVHSSDPTLTGVLKEGVHDLAGALAHAGYDAEAWASSRQQQQHQQQEDQRQQRRQQRRSDDYSSESFDPGLAGDDGPIRI